MQVTIFSTTCYTRRYATVSLMLYMHAPYITENILYLLYEKTYHYPYRHLDRYFMR